MKNLPEPPLALFLVNFLIRVDEYEFIFERVTKALNEEVARDQAKEFMQNFWSNKGETDDSGDVWNAEGSAYLVLRSIVQVTPEELICRLAMV